MARKGNQQNNSLHRQSSNHKKEVSDSLSTFPNTKQRGRESETRVDAGEELPNGNQPTIPLTERLSKTDQGGDEKKRKQKLGKDLGSKRQGLDETKGLEKLVPSNIISGDNIEDMSTTEASDLREENGSSPISNIDPKNPQNSLGSSL